MNAGRPYRSEGCTEGLPEDAMLEQDPSEHKGQPAGLGEGQDGEGKARAKAWLWEGTRSVWGAEGRGSFVYHNPPHCGFMSQFLALILGGNVELPI